MAEECTVLCIRSSSCSFCREQGSLSLRHCCCRHRQPCLDHIYALSLACINVRIHRQSRSTLHHIYIAIFKHFNAISCAFSALKQRWSSCSQMAICALHVFDNISLIHIDFLSRRPRLNLLGEVRPTSIADPAPPFSLPTPPLPLFNSKIYRPPSSQCGHIYSSRGDT